MKKVIISVSVWLWIGCGTSKREENRVASGPAMSEPTAAKKAMAPVAPGSGQPADMAPGIGKPRPVAPPPPVTLDAGKMRLYAEAMNRFTFKLYKEVRGRTAGNLHISGLSVGDALSLVLEGARGESLRAALKAFGIKDAALLGGGAGTLRASARHASTSFSLASRLWVARDVPLEKKYLARTARQYGAAAASADFHASVALAARVNRWVKTRTLEQIDGLISAAQITPQTRLLLLGALAFGGPLALPVLLAQDRFRALLP